MAGQPMTPISVRGLVKSFGAVQAVAGLDLDVEAGSVTALLGPNGAGKTTTLDILLGLRKADAGSVHLFGRGPKAALAAGMVGAVLQGGTLLPGVTVRELVGCHSAMYRNRMPMDRVVHHAMLDELMPRRVDRLSGGETQRVLFALALVGNPRALVLDEPTAAMDLAARRSFWAAVRDLVGDGLAVLFSTHYLEEADAIADRVVLLGRGRVVADGTAAEVRSIGGVRHIRCALAPAADVTLGSLPGVSGFERQGELVRIHSVDSDRTLRELLVAHPEARDIEVTAASLADALDALDALPPPPVGHPQRLSVAGGVR
ncbi:ABC transporter ATP-binding protein [Actinomycetes bacterium KLBMP 9759]